MYRWPNAKNTGRVFNTCVVDAWKVFDSKKRALAPFYGVLPSCTVFFQLTKLFANSREVIFEYPYKAFLWLLKNVLDNRVSGMIWVYIRCNLSLGLLVVIQHATLTAARYALPGGEPYKVIPVLALSLLLEGFQNPRVSLWPYDSRPTLHIAMLTNVKGQNVSAKVIDGVY